MKFTPEILQERLIKFAQRCRILAGRLPKNSHNIVYSNQLNRASSSPGANYIEAIEASSAKEFILKLKTCRKEIKESNYWLTLIQTSNENLIWVKKEIEELIKEGNELIKIFTASIITAERNQKIRNLKK
jgi:four helix bundle protein